VTCDTDDVDSLTTLSYGSPPVSVWVSVYNYD